MIRDLFILARPRHYIKNIIIFAPLFFSGMVLDEVKFLSSLYAFVFFSLAASSIYILNDLIDVNEDRKHPNKKKRPIASGAVGKLTAVIAMITFLAIAITGSVFLSHSVGMLVLTYVAVNILYSIWLKHIAILDVSLIGVGFVLRIFVGTAAIQSQTSMWIVLMTFLLALFLGFAKRRDDVLLLNDGERVRKNIDGYNLEFINAAMSIMAGVVLVAYISYTVSDEVSMRLNTDNLYLTVFFVILGIFRYLQITFVEERSGSPTKILYGDLFIQLTIICWIASFGFLIYFN